MTKKIFRIFSKKMSIIFASIVLFILIAFIANLTIWHKIAKVPERKYNYSPGTNSIIWIGHSTVLLHLDNVNIITDPMFSDYILIFAKRYFEPAIKFEKLPHIDAIVISHEHYDHFDKPTLERFDKDIPVIISDGLGKKVREIGFSDVRELKWRQNTEVKGIRITAVPADHGEAKISNYVIEGSKTIFFAGDTAFFKAFDEIGKKFDIDLALMPIGNYKLRSGIRWLDNIHARIHMSPADFPSAIKALRAEQAVPIHFGTFRNEGTLDLTLDEPPGFLRQIIKKHHLEKIVRIPELGEQIVIQPQISE